MTEHFIIGYIIGSLITQAAGVALFAYVIIKKIVIIKTDAKWQ